MLVTPLHCVLWVLVGDVFLLERHHVAGRVIGLVLFAHLIIGRLKLLLLLHQQDLLLLLRERNTALIAIKLCLSNKWICLNISLKLKGALERRKIVGLFLSIYRLVKMRYTYLMSTCYCDIGQAQIIQPSSSRCYSLMQFWPDSMDTTPKIVYNFTGS